MKADNRLKFCKKVVDKATVDDERSYSVDCLLKAK